MEIIVTKRWQVKEKVYRNARTGEETPYRSFHTRLKMPNRPDLVRVQLPEDLDDFIYDGQVLQVPDHLVAVQASGDFEGWLDQRVKREFVKAVKRYVVLVDTYDQRSMEELDRECARVRAGGTPEVRYVQEVSVAQGTFTESDLVIPVSVVFHANGFGGLPMGSQTLELGLSIPHPVNAPDDIMTWNDYSRSLIARRIVTVAFVYNQDASTVRLVAVHQDLEELYSALHSDISTARRRNQRRRPSNRGVSERPAPSRKAAKASLEETLPPQQRGRLIES